MEHRTGQIDLKRKSELLERTEASLDRLQTVHRELVDTHRQMEVEVQNLRDDVGHLDQQVHKESDLRKHLQQDKKQLQGQVETLDKARGDLVSQIEGAEGKKKTALSRTFADADSDFAPVQQQAHRMSADAVDTSPPFVTHLRYAASVLAARSALRASSSSPSFF